MVLTQTKRYRAELNEVGKSRQLSGLLSIISSNLLVAAEVLNSGCKVASRRKLELLSHQTQNLAKELMSNVDDEELIDRVSFLKHEILAHINDLTEELSQYDLDECRSEREIEDIILARRLLREAQRGLVTIHD